MRTRRTPPVCDVHARLIALVLLFGLPGCARVAGEDTPPPPHPEAPPTFYCMGSMSAFLTVCGCDDDLLGGLDRVGAYLTSHHGPSATAESAPWTLVDAGGFLADDDEMARSRAPVALDLLAWLRPAAVNVARSDLVFGAELLEERSGDLPFIGTLESSPTLRLARIGELTVGFIGISAVDGDDSSVETACEIARTAAVSARKAGAHALILLADSGVATARRAAVAAGGVSLMVLSSGGRSPVPVDGEGGPLISPGVKARHLARVELDPDTGALAAFEWIVMDRGLDPDRPRHLLDRIAEFDLEMEKLAVADAAERVRLANSGLKNPFVGSKACRECHGDGFDSPYEMWLEQEQHYRAFEIFTDLAEEWRRKRATPDCVVCHVVGFRRLDSPGGAPRYVWHEEGVGCESCHGAGAAHVEDPETTNIIRGSVLTAREEICALCHVPDHSPSFDYLRYLKRIRHWDIELEKPLRDGTIEVPAGAPEPIPGTPGHGGDHR